MQIKRVDISAYKLVVKLFDEYRVFYKQPPDIALAEHFIKERLTNNESVIFAALADVGGQWLPAGFTQLYPVFSSARASKNWLLNDLYVNSAFRKQGIGEALIKTAMDFAKEENASYIKLETAFDNYTAQRLYETIGFKKQEPGSAFFTYRMPLL